MKTIISKEKCCGCHACYTICPKKARDMVEDELGFKYPIINQKKCIDCGLCKKSCPIINNKEDIKHIKAYAAYNKNTDERLKSSSGGIFILIAKEIIKRGGVVFGATFDKDFNVIHTYVEKEYELVSYVYDFNEQEGLRIFRNSALEQAGAFSTFADISLGYQNCQPLTVLQGLGNESESKGLAVIACQTSGKVVKSCQ